jgi:hypothetical protein
MISRVRLPLVAVFLCACFAAIADERIEALEPHMGTMFRIVLYAGDPARAHIAIRAAFDRVADLDNKLSDYKPYSELTTICATAVGRDVPISEDLYTVLTASQSLADRTDGAFDVTLGPVIRLWRKARQTGRLPITDGLTEAARRTGYRKLHLINLGNRPAVRLDIEGMQLDLGAIAKATLPTKGCGSCVNTDFRRRWSPPAAISHLATRLPANRDGTQASIPSTHRAKPSPTFCSCTTRRFPPLATPNSSRRSMVSAILTSSIQERSWD